MKQLLFSFACALRGMRRALKSERNLQIHLLAAGAVCALAHLSGVEPWAWAALISCSALVVGAELLNTALEVLADRVESKKNALIRDAKDVAAGAVLCCAIGAIAVACVVFLRTEVFATLSRRLPALAGLAVVALFSLVCILRKR
ncbi:MAG: diacylglycerol kinase family protein [Eubacteriales bacterium]|nr:diacylglycerol kinase family protein [Christensenellaceae bacterium]MEA5066598.1 diacylglycerol kinase family protein [Eubacteriales bacterium]